MRISLLFLFLPLVALGQGLSLGVVGGAAITDAVQDQTFSQQPYSTRWWSQKKDWIAGLALEYRFHSNLSVEVDGLYRELHATWAGVMPDGTLNSVSPSPVVTFEFPVLAKYRFGPIRGWRPFIEAGPSFRTTGNLNFTPSHFGLSGGAGITTDWHGLAIAPTIRYTRWRPDPNGYGAPNLSGLNQVELLVSVSKATESAFHPLGDRVELGLLAGYGLTRDQRSTTSTGHYVYVNPDGSTTPVDATQYVSGLRSLDLGAQIGVRVTDRWSVELDALHRPIRESTRVVYSDGAIYQGRAYTNYSSWQFPVLARYTLGTGKVSPFLEAGPSFRINAATLSPYAATGGAGVSLRWRVLRIEPQLRYSHWGAPRAYATEYARNEVTALVGFSVTGRK